jgi:hypothetical protein
MRRTVASPRAASTADSPFNFPSIHLTLPKRVRTDRKLLPGPLMPFSPSYPYIQRPPRCLPDRHGALWDIDHEHHLHFSFPFFSVFIIGHPVNPPQGFGRSRHSFPASDPPSWTLGRDKGRSTVAEKSRQAIRAQAAVVEKLDRNRQSSIRDKRLRITRHK